ncbi:hypothetical protein FKW77_000607 [Venturia effusa]|uniref:Uncharacterized protein n=1 Tax=Venturia effusa TaxID=50376 RepID=A0A517LA93_9PEZI|nr:hypothetical protein FKW77_000607 [Venturia effusa]
MNVEQSAASKESEKQTSIDSKEASFRVSFTSNASTTASFCCETAAEIERRARTSNPLSIEAWASSADEFEAPVSNSPKINTSLDRSASVNAAEHVSLSPSKLAPAKKVDVRKVTPPNPTLSSSPEQFETGPWSPVNPPPTPHASRTPKTPRTRTLSIKAKQAATPPLTPDPALTPAMTRPDMPFPFLKLPDLVRRQIYSYLGFQGEPQISLFADKHRKAADAIRVRRCYSVDFNRSGQLSQPWTRAGRRQNLGVHLPLMFVNREICDELYSLLYSNCLFTVHLQGHGETHVRSFSPRAYKYITHMTLSYNIHPNSARHHELLFNTSDDKDALVAAIGAVTALAPDLIYFGIGFWSPGLKSLFPNFSFDPEPALMLRPTSNTKNGASKPSTIVLPVLVPRLPAKTSSKTALKQPKQTHPPTTETTQPKHPIEFDHSWLTSAINALVHKGQIKTFALWRDGRGCAVLDWNREKRNIMKGNSRDLGRAIAKVLN